jgi:hypothetical protein
MGRRTVLYSRNMKGGYIVVELEEVGFEGVDCIHLAQDIRVVNIVRNLRVP